FGRRRKDALAEAVAEAAVAAVAVVAVVEVAEEVGGPAAAEALGPAVGCLAQAAACRGRVAACPDRAVVVRVLPLAEAVLDRAAEYLLADEPHRLVRPVVAPVRLNCRPIVPD